MSVSLSKKISSICNELQYLTLQGLIFQIYFDFFVFNFVLLLKQLWMGLMKNLSQGEG